MEALKQYLVPFIISNIFFALCIPFALKKPMWVRIFFVGFFLWACFINSFTAINIPEVYLDYGKLTFIPLYRNFIFGFFSRHIQPFVLTIAFGQFLIAFGLVLNKTWTSLSCAGGIIFGLAIAPFGVGSGFPSTVSMAIAFFILMKKYEHDFIWKWKQYRS